MADKPNKKLAAGADLVGAILNDMHASASTGTQKELKELSKHKDSSAKLSAKGRVETESKTPPVSQDGDHKTSGPSKASCQSKPDVARSANKTSKSDKQSPSGSQQQELGKASDKHSSKTASSSRHTSSSDYDTKKQLADITKQLQVLSDSMSLVTPIVTELKAARDEWLEQENFESEEGEYSGSDKEDQEPPAKKLRLSSDTGSSTAFAGEGSGSGGTSGTDILLSMAKSVNLAESTGPAINEQLAKVVTQYLERGMDKESFEKLLEKSVRPENCDRLKVVRVNSAIFNNVSKDTKQEDICLQKVQRPLVAGIINLVTMLDQLLKSSETANMELLSVLSKTIGILCTSSHELDIRRRWLFKSEMKEEYKALCSESHPVEGELFGDQLSQSVKDLNETNKVTSKLTKRKSYGRQGQIPPFLGSSFRPRSRFRTNRPPSRQFKNNQYFQNKNPYPNKHRQKPHKK